MRFAGIIAEYDPFHNGHAWQLAQARALGAQRVAVAMSCGLTQRGALPLLPESVRVRAALECGADLVFALPAPWACAGAEAFARAGVHLLAATGCDALVFGAETPDAALLLETARVLNSAAYRAALKQQLAAGARSFAAARQAAVQAVGADPAMAALLSQPNNNLAVEYCRAILEQRAGMTPVPLPRRGANHGQTLEESGHAQFASASALVEPRPWPRLCRKRRLNCIKRRKMTARIRILTRQAGVSWPCCGQPAQSRSLLQRCAECPKGWNTGWNTRCDRAPVCRNCWMP